MSITSPMIRYFLLLVIALLSFTVSASSPSRVSFFKASSYIITSGERTLLQWGAPAISNGTVYYNLSVKKPDGSAKWTKLNMVLDLSFNRLINMPGRHYFYVQACNAAKECSAETSLSVLVKEPAIVPGAVSSFTSNRANIAHGESILLNWERPSSFSGYLTYNLYVTKPGHQIFLWRGDQTDYSEIRGGQTGILLSGRHYIHIEACNDVGDCGPLETVDFFVGGPPPAVWSFDLDKPEIKQGEVVSLSWAMHINYTKSVRYNLYVQKSGSTSKVPLLTNSGDTNFDYVSEAAGNHTFLIEACDVTEGCGGTKPLALTVNSSRPNGVASFTVDKATINHGESVILSWARPLSYSGNLVYNLYVTKPGTARFLWRNGLTGLSEIRGGDTGINRSGTHLIEIEACNEFGDCGPLEAVEFFVGGPPPAVWSFDRDKSEIKQGEVVSLSWAMHINYTKSVRYNLYVQKSGSTSKVPLLTNSSDTNFDYVSESAGNHTFLIEACDVTAGCGSTTSVFVEVSSLGVYAHPESGSLYLHLANNRYFKLTKQETKWVVSAISQSEWDNISSMLTPSDYSLEYGFFAGDSLEDIKLTSHDSSEIITLENLGDTYKVYYPLNTRSIIFIHTDLLGTPIAESDKNGKVAD